MHTDAWLALDTIDSGVFIAIFFAVFPCRDPLLRGCQCAQSTQ